ncbi:MAG: lamin tail domain-containing protein [Tannerellaceae bacterium]|nr:lamin tail domain-containing protein [Tannerellaceae bacterium]MCD8263405.1 lamin tail domain-containing protein [Tannerellaceae bacterium]
MKHFLLVCALLLSFHSFAQLEDSFNDPESLWQGDTDLFTLSPEGILEFTSPENEAGTVSIYHPITYGKDMTWEMDIKTDFHTTNSNYVRLNLYATGQSSSDPLFYVQVGTNNRQISLYCNRSHTSVRCIAERADLLEEPYEYVRIRVTLENQQTWTLYTCKAGEEAFTLEGSYTINLANDRPGGFLNIGCQYIKSRISTFYLDNIRVEPYITPFPDVLPGINEPELPSPLPAEELPELIDIFYPSATNLLFQYTSSINIDQANIHITDIGDASKIIYGSDNREMVATFPAEIQDNRTYIIKIEGIQDLRSGEKLPEEIFEISLEAENKEPDENEKPAGNIPPGAVLINEIMANPKGLELLPETEYVELYNTLDQQVSLDGWNFVYNSKPVPLDGIYIPANGYLVLYREGRDIYTAPEGLAVELTKFPANLANDGKDILLTNKDDTIIHEVIYAKATAARSWERNADNEWYLSTDPQGGTPGYKNSSVNPDEEEETGQPTLPYSRDIQPGEIIFNELLPEPFPEGSEYIELYNRSDRTLSFANLAIATRKSDGTLSTNYSLSSITQAIQPEEYIVISKDIEGVTAFYETNEEVLHQLKMPILANTSSTLVLFRTDTELIIDEVNYSSKWYSPAIKNKKELRLSASIPTYPHRMKQTGPLPRQQPAMVHPAYPIHKPSRIIATMRSLLVLNRLSIQSRPESIPSGTSSNNPIIP